MKSLREFVRNFSNSPRVAAKQKAGFRSQLINRIARTCMRPPRTAHDAKHGNFFWQNSLRLLAQIFQQLAMPFFQGANRRTPPAPHRRAAQVIWNFKRNRARELVREMCAAQKRSAV